MHYRVLKAFTNPVNGRTHKPGQVVDLFHTVGDPLCEGKNPVITRSVKNPPDVALAKKLENQKDMQ